MNRTCMSCMVFLFSIHNLDMHTIVAWSSSAQQVGCLSSCLYMASCSYHLLAPLFYMSSYAISSMLHFTLYTPSDYAQNSNPNCSLFHFFPNLARLPHYPPALQSPFSFHLGCGYARKKGGKNEKYLVIPVT